MSETEDESLDFRSESFDPLKALYSTGVNIPVPSATTFPTVDSYAIAARSGQISRPQTKQKKNEPLPSTSQFARKFLPHQMPVSRPLPARCSRTVLTRMTEHLSSGPLGALAICMDRRLRIKVYTRHMSGVRGYVEAFVVAFDKHWNMALEDVREVWVRRKRPRVPALGAASVAAAKLPGGGSRLARARRGAVPPRVLTQPLDGGRERCERHVGQLLMRGEHVVLVAVHNLQGDSGGGERPPAAASSALQPPSAPPAPSTVPATTSADSATTSTPMDVEVPASSAKESVPSTSQPKSAMGLSDAVAAAIAAAMAASKSDEEDD